MKEIACSIGKNRFNSVDDTGLKQISLTHEKNLMNKTRRFNSVNKYEDVVNCENILKEFVA